MRKLYNHPLNFELALAFFKDSLEETNTLSIEIIKFICCQNGRFFTLLPDNADLAKLHQFTQGILPEMPMQRGPVGNLPGIYTYSKISSLEEELCNYLINKIKKHNFSCIFDHYNATYNNGNGCELFESYGRHYEREVYYFIDRKNVSEQSVIECLYASKTFWHSLCILTEADFHDPIDRALSTKMIQEICLKSRLAIVGAYDGEGYIFWEKNE